MTKLHDVYPYRPAPVRAWAVHAANGKFGGYSDGIVGRIFSTRKRAEEDAASERENAYGPYVHVIEVDIRCACDVMDGALSSATAENERLRARRQDEGLQFAFDALARCGWWSDQRSQFEVSEKALILAIGGVMPMYAEPIEALMKAWRKESP